MVQIGNFNLSIPGMSGIGQYIGPLLLGTLIVIMIGLLVWWLVVSYRNKIIYVTPVRLIRLLDNGVKKEMNGIKGGKVTHNGIMDFACKVPKQMKLKYLGYVPDYSKADGDGRLTFITSGDGSLWQQVDERLITEESQEIVNGQEVNYLSTSLLIKPIPTDIKTVTVNNLQNWKQVLDKNKLTDFGIAIGGFIIMVIAHLISLYIQTKIKCPAAT